jgi:hypothetical protein
MMRGISAIEIVADEVRSERAAQLGHFDAVETKAGVLLGFAGAITALSSRPVGPFSASGLGAAVLSGLLALMSFWPRKYWRTDLEALRARYLAADPAFARIRLLDSQIVMAERSYRTLAWKVRFLKLAMVSLAAAVPLSALGTALE